MLKSILDTAIFGNDSTLNQAMKFVKSFVSLIACDSSPELQRLLLAKFFFFVPRGLATLRYPPWYQ